MGTRMSKKMQFGMSDSLGHQLGEFFGKYMEDPSGHFCKCGVEMCIGDYTCFGRCFDCYKKDPY